MWTCEAILEKVLEQIGQISRTQDEQFWKKNVWVMVNYEINILSR